VERVGTLALGSDLLARHVGDLAGGGHEALHVTFGAKVDGVRTPRRRGAPCQTRASRKGEGVYDPEVLRNAAEKSRRRTTRVPVPRSSRRASWTSRPSSSARSRRSPATPSTPRRRRPRGTPSAPPSRTKASSSTLRRAAPSRPDSSRSSRSALPGWPHLRPWRRPSDLKLSE
jgi:hypothetical protein